PAALKIKPQLVQIRLRMLALGTTCRSDVMQRPS
ncbi:MAG: hypothetical protein JWR59_1631, partial [Brevundimonas sp.]|nr:hypothetical protein [Brevundimonas sp.]